MQIGMHRRLADDHADLFVGVVRVLADATRVQLLWSAPSVSRHRAKLRMARLVRTRREGTQVVGDAVFNAEHAAGGVPAHHRGGIAELPCKGRA